MDYTHPDGDTIDLAVIGARATDPVHRIGSLLTNPGGPGGSGVGFIRDSYRARAGAPSLFDAPLRAVFDIVGFDPRGVGRGAPVRCLSDAELDDYTALDGAPTTPSHIAALVAGDQSFAAGCHARSAGLLPYLGTPNAARDLDLLRAVLGDQKLYYLGFSYGTYLGAIYTGLFPTRVGRLVLDGPQPPNVAGPQLDLGQASGFQDELDRFITDCVTHPDCPLGTDRGRAAGKLTDFLASTRAHPLSTGTHRVLTEALAETGVTSPLYTSPHSWAHLRQVLTQAIHGDGAGLLRLADHYNQRDPDTGHYANTGAANAAINCLDHPSPVHSPADVATTLPAYQAASPLIGATAAWAELLCAYWPVTAPSPAHPIHYTGTPPILVVGTTHDPATPYPGAQNMTHQLGSALLLTYNGDGHTAYGRGSDCINNAVDTYLTHATPTRHRLPTQPPPPH